jgi:hypothetical protein
LWLPEWGAVGDLTLDVLLALALELAHGAGRRERPARQIAHAALALRGLLRGSLALLTLPAQPLLLLPAVGHLRPSVVDDYGAA